MSDNFSVIQIDGNLRGFAPHPTRLSKGRIGVTIEPDVPMVGRSVTYANLTLGEAIDAIARDFGACAETFESRRRSRSSSERGRTVVAK